jgi:hypothetical protein
MSHHPLPGDIIEWWDESAQQWRPGVLRSVTFRYRVTGELDPMTDGAGWSIFATDIRSNTRPVATQPANLGPVETW